jgi:phenylalanyl-tRNA synthetase beta subunit
VSGRQSPPSSHAHTHTHTSTPPASSRVRILTRPEVALVRPFIVGAVLRGLTLDAARYASLIELQDRLHGNLCRHRSLVAIGTHDLAALTPPFTYDARPPAAIEFVPLKQDRAWRADDLLAVRFVHVFFFAATLVALSLRPSQH